MENISHERLLELVSFDAETGVFTRRVALCGKSKIGDRADIPDGRGYHRVRVDSKRYKAHRLAWFYVYGVWPADEIDHINKDGTDNALSNLREASHIQNSWNRNNKRTHGIKGVSFYKSKNKWGAYISAGRQIHLGYFKSQEDAQSARETAALTYHREFACS